MPGEREDFPIARVAALARLELSPAEFSLFQSQLEQIVAFVGQVTAAGLDASAAGDHLRPAAAGAERPDEVRPSLPAGVALANAPDPAPGPGLVRVPKVI